MVHVEGAVSCGTLGGEAAEQVAALGESGEVQALASVLPTASGARCGPCRTPCCPLPQWTCRSADTVRGHSCLPDSKKTLPLSGLDSWTRRFSPQRFDHCTSGAQKHTPWHTWQAFSGRVRPPARRGGTQQAPPWLLLPSGPPDHQAPPGLLASPPALAGPPAPAFGDLPEGACGLSGISGASALTCEGPCLLLALWPRPPQRHRHTCTGFSRAEPPAPRPPLHCPRNSWALGTLPAASWAGIPHLCLPVPGSLGHTIPVQPMVVVLILF